MAKYLKKEAIVLIGSSWRFIMRNLVFFQKTAQINTAPCIHDEPEYLRGLCWIDNFPIVRIRRIQTIVCPLNLLANRSETIEIRLDDLYLLSLCNLVKLSIHAFRYKVIRFQNADVLARSMTHAEIHLITIALLFRKNEFDSLVVFCIATDDL